MADKLVLVSGVSGYVASHIVKLLQESGYRVRGTVRSLKDAARIAPLTQLAKNPKHGLELVEADLVRDDGWDKAMEGVYAVMHTASPFPPIGADVKEEAIFRPAIEGTRRVLAAAANAGVKKVVVTSSIIAVVGKGGIVKGKKYNEEEWTDHTSEEVTVYGRSKTLAERAAWEFLDSQPEDKKFELSTVNPALVMGPPLMESHRSATSVGIMRDTLSNKPPFLPSINFPVCDVRDVALAHLKCLTNPGAVGKRHLISSGAIWFKGIHEIVGSEFNPQGCRITTRSLPNFLVRVAALFDQGVRMEVLPRLDEILELDTSRMTDVLGIKPTPMKSSLLDMAYAMMELGIVDKPAKYSGPKFSQY
ncbi:phenylacetaldehyde reductase [Hyalella azteca]|uniref:Phenylacetaldehyde reductase n=1 Tax=Hyalella azteca TaxID=294128 RepID=A0A8B7P1E1_HYAAZ|nr:phenylacetaldehyde reductase [Hyalella azteca]